jgi:FtsP/CotA-like multicopper oxidase with cupredoxin domain
MPHNARITTGAYGHATDRSVASGFMTATARPVRAASHRPYGGAFLGALVAALLAVVGCSADDGSRSADQPVADDGDAEVAQPTGGDALPVPPLLVPITEGGVKVFQLDATRGRSSFLGDEQTDTMGFNGDYLGPTIRVTEGDDVRMEVTNRLGEDTTVHWPGLHVPAMADGGPASVIAEGATWRPEFTIRQEAASLWYHPHPMGETTRQVGMGLTGMLIVDDESAAQAALPHDYGVNDFPLVLQSQYFDANGQIVHVDVAGMDGVEEQVVGRAVLANGAVTPVLDTDQSRVRLRVLNASTTEFLTLSFSDGAPFSWIASDGGLLPDPLEVTAARLGPADRIELIVDLTGDRTLQATVDQGLPRDGGQEAEAGDAGAEVPEEADDAEEPDDDPEFLTEPVDVLALEGHGSEPPPAAMPSPLNTIEPLDPTGVEATTVELTGSEGDGDLGINGVSMTSMSDLDHTHHALRVRQGDVVVWDVHNATDDEHNLHVHDQQFQVLSIDGAPPPPELGGREDTVSIPAGSTMRIAMRFDDYADPTIGYMFHCHLLPHEDGGMSSMVVVEPAA